MPSALNSRGAWQKLPGVTITVFLALAGIIGLVCWLFLRSAREEQRVMSMIDVFFSKMFEERRKEIEAMEAK